MYPSLSVARALQRDPGAAPSFLYLGRADGIEGKLVEHAQIPFQAIDVGAFRGMGPVSMARNLARLVSAIGRCRAIIREFRPNAIFATGGYVSAPVIWASALERVPSLLYLPDLEPGWAIRASARWATRIAVSFDEVARFFPRRKVVTTGYPVRPEFARTNQTLARQKFQLDPAERTITIFGGSRGAKSINQAVARNLSELAHLGQLILITGKEDEAWLTELSRQFGRRVRVFGYLDEDFVDALAAADVVVSRAGAATLGEYPALGLPAVLVPYPFAGKHQKLNADFLVRRGAAVEIANQDLERDLLPALEQLFASTVQVERMNRAARALAVPDAADRMAKVLREIAAPALAVGLSG